jgi:hypothetical protein
MYSFSDRHAPRRRAGKINWKVVGCTSAALFALLFLACAASIGGYFFWYMPAQAKAAQEKERQQIRDAFAPELSSYLNYQVKPPARGAANKFKGKVVCVDMSAKQIDAEAQAALPESLRAAKPDEVGCVAQLTWSAKEVGDYDDGSKAKISVVEVKLLDKKTGSTLLLSQTIFGPNPEAKITGGDRVGPKPFDKIAELLGHFAEAN